MTERTSEPDQSSNMVPRPAHGYFWAEDAIIDTFGSRLGLQGVGLLTYFKRRAAKDGSSFPAVKRIQKDLNIGSPNTVNRYIQRLVELQLLRVWKSRGKLQFQILSLGGSISAGAPIQKVIAKEYPMKEHTKKEDYLQPPNPNPDGISVIREILEKRGGWIPNQKINV